MKRAVQIRFGHYKGNVRDSACRAMYSFLGHFNNSLFLNIASSNHIINMPRGSMSSVVGGFVDYIDGSSLVAPAICLRPEPLLCRNGAIVRVRIGPDTRIRSCGGRVFSQISSTSMRIADASRVTVVCVHGRDVFARQGMFPCVGIRSLQLSLLPAVERVTTGSTGNQRV